MLTTYAKRDPLKNYFPVPNAVFDLELHHIAINIYAYPLRIEDRRTDQCIASYPAIAKKLGLSVNTVMKYVRMLEERGLVRTEHTEFVTKDGIKRNGRLRYHILPIQNAIDLYHVRKLLELELATARQKAEAKAEELGVAFIPAGDGQSA